MSFIMYLPEGCSKKEIQILDAKDPIDSLDQFRDILKKDMTFAHIVFGSNYKYVAIFDDNGLLKDSPISTVEINNNMLHGPVFIIKNNDSEDDEDWHGISKEDIKFLKAKLNLLGGSKIYDKIPEPQIFTTTDETEFFDVLAKHNNALDKENKNIWVDRENVIDLFPHSKKDKTIEIKVVVELICIGKLKFTIGVDSQGNYRLGFQDTEDPDCKKLHEIQIEGIQIKANTSPLLFLTVAMPSIENIMAMHCHELED